MPDCPAEHRDHSFRKFGFGKRSLYRIATHTDEDAPRRVLAGVARVYAYAARLRDLVAVYEREFPLELRALAVRDVVRSAGNGLRAVFKRTADASTAEEKTA